MITVSHNLVLFYWFNLILFTSCSDNDYQNDDIQSAISIDSLESLKAAFDQGLITHVDFKTVKQDNILNDEIIAMELIQSNEVVSFPQIKLTSQSEYGDMHDARLTLSTNASRIVIEGTRFNPWAKTLTYFNGNEIKEFAPYTSIFESGITSSGLNILSDTLQIHFY